MSTDDRHERFDQPTVELVAKALPFALPSASRGVARHVLNALADAGLLLPPDGHQVEEWGVLWANVGHLGGTEHHTVGDKDTIQMWAANMRAEMAAYTRREPLNIDWVKVRRRTRIIWPNDSTYTGPWTEVPQ